MPKSRFVNYQRLKISLLKFGVKKLDRECKKIGVEDLRN
jgi:hypothetical protein